MLERVVEIEAKVPFEQVRKLLTRTHAVELCFDKQIVWETGKAAPDALRVLKALKIPAPPRVLGPSKP